MTRIDRVLVRETAVGVRDGGRSRPLLVELHPRHVELRLKGTRRRLVLAYDAMYDLAAKMLARAAAAERLEQRKAKRKGAKR
jgi:prophage tail gpP-like protein